MQLVKAWPSRVFRGFPYELKETKSTGGEVSTGLSTPPQTRTEIGKKSNITVWAVSK
jgi:hypothetical protein